MNRPTIFKFDFVNDQTDESNQYEFDERILNSNHSTADRLDKIYNNKKLKDLHDQSNRNSTYQLNRQFNQRFNKQFSREFSQELNHRLNQHLNQVNQHSLRTYINGKNSELDQNKLLNFFIHLNCYLENSIIEIKLKFNFFLNYLIFWIRFLFIDLFHHFIFKFLLNQSYQKKILLKWINKVTDNKLIPNDKLNYLIDKNSLSKIDNLNRKNETISFTHLFSNGKLLCGLVNHLNVNACSRFDLLDSEDSHVNLELAYRLILTHYSLDKKINLANLEAFETEQKLINLIEKIHYFEAKKDLRSRYGFERDHFNRNSIFAQDNYLIRGMGLFAAVRNRVSFFNIFYFKFVDIVIEIIGPRSYACKRIKVDNFKSKKSFKKYDQIEKDNEYEKNELMNDKYSWECKKDNNLDRKEIPLIVEIHKKQLISISYIPIDIGIHTISIVHQGANILQSPYVLKVDEELI